MAGISSSRSRNPLKELGLNMNLVRMKCLSLATVLMMSVASYAEVYVYTDSHGRRHYSNTYGKKPHAKAAAPLAVCEKSVSFAELPSGMAPQATVVLYGMDSCAAYRLAKKYLDSQGIVYVDRNIAKDAAALNDYKALQAHGVPVLFYGAHRLNGFTEEGFNHIYR